MELIDLVKELDEKKDEDLAAKKVAFGHDLPDIEEWEEYIGDKQVKWLFQTSLNTLLDASDKVIRELENKPRT